MSDWTATQQSVDDIVRAYELLSGENLLATLLNIVRTAEQRGAERMREAAAKCSDEWMEHDPVPDGIPDAIRALAYMPQEPS